MSLFTTKYKNNTRVVNGTVNATQDDVTLLCNTSSAPVIINLNEIPVDYWNTLYKLYIFDNSNNANVNNITIVAPTGYKINNAQTLVIGISGGGAIVRIGSNTNYLGTLNYVQNVPVFSVTDTEEINLTLTGGNDLSARLQQQGATSGQVLSWDGNSWSPATISVSGAITIANTVFVAKNGNDSTGIVQRLDRPFLTIAAARTALLAFWTGGTAPSATNRILVKVFEGTWTDEVIVLDNFVDYELTGLFIKTSTAVNEFMVNDNGVAVDSRITGDAFFLIDVALGFSDIGFVKTLGSGTSLLMECSGFSSTNWIDAIAFWSEDSYQLIRTNDIVVPCASLFFVTGTGSQYVYWNIAVCSGNGALSGARLISNTGSGSQALYGAEVRASVSASVIFSNEGSGTQDIYVNKITNTSVGGRCIVSVNGATGMQRVYNSIITGNYPSNDVVEMGAANSQTLNNCRIENAGANAHAVGISANGIIINNCTLIANGTGNSLYAGSALNALVYGACQANKAVNVNVTQQVGTINVSALVV